HAAQGGGGVDAVVMAGRRIAVEMGVGQVQDAHGSTVAIAGVRQVKPAKCADGRLLLAELSPGPAGRAQPSAPTHSLSPSSKTWCFQIGTRCLTVSTSSSQATKACLRCGAATAQTSAESPISSGPNRWATAMRISG